MIGCLLLALATVLTLAVVGRYEREHGLAELESRLAARSSIKAAAFERQMLAMQRDVRFLASVPPVSGLVRAGGTHGVDVEEHTPGLLWQRRLETIFQAFALANPEIYQVRLIGMADQGREQVRVDRRGDKLVVVSEQQMQAKGDTEYVRQTARLSAGQVYVSDLNLNREHGKVELPPVPVVRVATPLLQGDKLFGMVVINYYAEGLLAPLSADMPAGYHAYLTNSAGDFLLHPNQQRSFGFDLGQRWRWSDEFWPAGVPAAGGPAAGAPTPASSTDAVSLSDLLAGAMQGLNSKAGLVHAVSRPLVLDPAHAERNLQYAIAVPDQLIDAAVQRTRLNVLAAMLGGAVVVGGAGYLYLGQRRFAEAHIRALNVSLEAQVRERTGRIVSYSTLQRAILAHASYAIVATDREGRVTLFNPAAERLMGYKAEEVLGLTPGIWHDPAEVAARAAELSQQLQRTIEPGFDVFAIPADSGVGNVREWTCIRKDGTRLPMQLSTSAIRGDDGVLAGFLGIASDISARKQDEDTLRAATRAADSANRAKSEFLANMSHEIRSPMNAVLGMLMLLKQTALDARQFDYTSKAEAAGRALLGILNDILDFSRVEAGKLTLDPQPFSLDQLLREIAVILSANVGDREVEVLYEVDPALPHWVVGDSMRLQQVLINLAGNAIKFTQRGEVVVTVQLLPPDADHPDTLWLGFAIRDTGIGISPEQCQRIFDGFSQAEASTARRFGGSGLGLAISRRLVQLMGGTLTVESTVGQGSTFRFSVACQAAPDAMPAPEARPHARQVTEGLLTGLHCLVVDDYETARELLAGMLHTFGWKIDVAASGAAALEAVQHRAQAGEHGYDAIFLDWRMPGMDGWETSERIAALSPPGQLPLMLMVTAHGREMLVQRRSELEAKMDGYLVKPVTASMLFDAVADARIGKDKTRLAARMDALPASPAAQPAPARVQRLKGLRLLVAEDNPTNQQVARELLGYEGGIITVADDGNAAIAAIRNADEPFDCVLMDIQMPDMDGYQATHVIRHELNLTSLPIIAMTANAMSTDRDAALAAGMNDHVGKPFDLMQLVDTILQHCAPAEDTAAKLALDLNR